MTPYDRPADSRWHRLYLGIFALAALAMLLATAWLRFLVPARHGAPRLRDVTWLSPPGR
ncbi:MAG TPA: hypothetical protein VFP65_05850 [Anaeromyxobacteraceae bacterium]|nr:hypothetical protein [Anaeromyxobacteraceae bacterium]